MKTDPSKESTELRRKAKAKLKAKGKSAPAVGAVETQRLVEELQIHQEELEMQNEELTQLRAEVEAALHQYTELYDFAPVGYFTLGKNGDIQKVNLNGALALGMERAALMKRHLGQYVTDEYRNDFNFLLQKVYASGMNQTCEVMLLKKDHDPFWAQLEAVCSVNGETVQLVLVDISERKQAEAALATEKRRLADIIEGIRVGSWEWNVQSGETVFNERWAEIIGYTLNELAPISIETWTKFTHPDDLKHSVELLERHFKGELDYYEMEVRMRHKNGHWIWVLDRGKVATRTEDGRPLLMSGSHQDITERKLAESKYRGLVERLPFVVYTNPLDDPFSTNYVSPQIQSMLGYSPQEWLADPSFWTQTLPAEDLERVRAEGTRVKASGESLDIEYRMTTRDGREIWVRDLFALIRDSDGRPEFWQGTMIDITERKLAEEALHESEEQYRTLVEQLPAIIYIDDNTEVEGRTAYISPQIETILGFTPQEWQVESPDLWSKQVHPDDLEQAHAGYMRCFLYGEAFDAEYRIHASDGRLLWFRDQAVMLPNENGKPHLIHGVIFDITERKQAEETIREYAANLERRVEERTAELIRANRVKDEFLANMSHELRTPLNGILGFSESLLEGIRGPLTDRQSAAVEIIQSSGRHLLELINDVLDVSKIEAGKFEFHPEFVSVNDICHSSLNFIKELANKKYIAVEYSPSPEAASIVADPRRMKQILVNLLNNAVKFTPEKGKVTLKVQTDSERSQMRFSVTDTGIGIAPDDLSKLFKPFVQLDSSLSRQYEGTGLGLMLVQKLVEMHSGEVQVESAAGSGSCFTVILPWIQEPEIQVDRRLSFIDRRKKVDEVKAAVRKTGSILLAEDNEDNLTLIRDYLEYKGYQMFTARNGNEALAMANELAPTLILMDVQMPQMDGLEATRRLRATPGFAAVPIIMLTAFAMPEDRERCLASGANEYLTKPVDLKLLNQAIEKYTGGISPEVRTDQG